MHRGVTVLHCFMCQYLTFVFFFKFCVFLFSKQQSLQVSNRLYNNPLGRRERLKVVGFFTNYTFTNKTIHKPSHLTCFLM